MEQKFKVGDLVKVSRGDGSFYYGTIERVFETYCQVVSTFNRSTLFPSNSRIELAYPSDHDLLDFASRDSKIAELTAENEALKAELEKYKPKPESREVELYLYRTVNGKVDWTCGKCRENILARKTVTITEGEGM